MIKKWLYKLRYLLLILSSVLGLLWLSSSFAWYTRPIGVYWYNPYIQSFDINLTRAWNPLTQVLWYTKQVFVLNQYAWYNWQLNFVAWWRWQKWLPYIYSRRVRWDSNYWSIAQWYIKSYSVCSELLWSETTMPGNCTYSSVWSDTSSIFWTFLKSLSTWDYYYFDYYLDSPYRNDAQGSFCISSSFYWYSLCFSLNSTDDLSDSLWLENLDFDSLSSLLLYNPPSWWWGWWAIWWDTPLEPDSEKVYYSDNNQIYFDTFKAIWYTEDLCYSNFSLNNVVDIHTAYYDLFPSPSAWNWASIFDLYNNWSYSVNNPFNAYFSWYSSRYNRLNSSSDKGTMFIMSLYSWVSIWNYYIFDKLLNHEFIEAYETVSYKDYYSFCNMALNWFDPDWLFTWETSIWFDNIMISQPCIRNWTCISESWEFIFSGANELWYFSWSDWIIDVFNRIYSNVKTLFKVDRSLVWTVWFLPDYIIFGFFMFVLLYLLKR